jgi:hypothetical protein
MKYKISEFAAQSFGEVRKEDHAKGLHQNLGNWGLQQGERHPYGMGGLRQAAASLPYKGLIQHSLATWGTAYFSPSLYHLPHCLL